MEKNGEKRRAIRIEMNRFSYDNLSNASTMTDAPYPNEIRTNNPTFCIEHAVSEPRLERIGTNSDMRRVQSSSLLNPNYQGHHHDPHNNAHGHSHHHHHHHHHESIGRLHNLNQLHQIWNEALKDQELDQDFIKEYQVLRKAYFVYF
jgi:hypothetical protein